VALEDTNERYWALLADRTPESLAVTVFVAVNEPEASLSRHHWSGAEADTMLKYDIA